VDHDDQENNLVGCVNPDLSDKYCANLPSITWRFVTAMARRAAPLDLDGRRRPAGRAVGHVDGPRVDHTYDPMRKQGAILLGNGGDNSNASQGTFYEGAMTAPGTFRPMRPTSWSRPNVVAAKYDVARLTLSPASPKLRRASPHPQPLRQACRRSRRGPRRTRP